MLLHRSTYAIPNFVFTPHQMDIAQLQMSGWFGKEKVMPAGRKKNQNSSLGHKHLRLSDC